MEPSIFDTVPMQDALHFGGGKDFNARKVVEWMELDNKTVSRLSAVAPSSVRYDDNIPKAVRDRLEEIGSIANLVAQIFNGDGAKTALWFRTSNPMLGDVSPRDMVRLGRYDKLRKFICGAMAAQGEPVTRPVVVSGSRSSH